MSWSFSVFFYKFYSFNSSFEVFDWLWVSFCVGYKVRVQIHSFTCGYPVFSAPFAEKTVLSLLNGLGLLVKIIWSYMWGFISGLSNLFHWPNVYLYASTTLFWLPWLCNKFFFNFYFFNKFIYFWLHWVFVAVCGLSLVGASGGFSSLRCAGFSLRWLLLLWSRGSRCGGFSSCGSWALERRLSSCARVQLLCGMWDLPGPGLEPVSSALAGRFLTTAPPGKSL